MLDASLCPRCLGELFGLGRLQAPTDQSGILSSRFREYTKADGTSNNCKPSCHQAKTNFGTTTTTTAAARRTETSEKSRITSGLLLSYHFFEEEELQAFESSTLSSPPCDNTAATLLLKESGGCTHIHTYCTAKTTIETGRVRVNTKTIQRIHVQMWMNLMSTTKLIKWLQSEL